MQDKQPHYDLKLDLPSVRFFLTDLFWHMTATHDKIHDKRKRKEKTCRHISHKLLCVTCRGLLPDVGLPVVVARLLCMKKKKGS